MKKKIFLYASEISIITGHNKFEKKSKVINRILNDYFPIEYKKITEILKSKDLELNPIDNKKYIESISKKYKIDLDNSLNKTLNTNNITDLNKCKKELINNLEKELIKNNVSKEEKAEITKSVKSLANTNFGLKFENVGLQKYFKENKELIVESKTFFKKKIIENDQFEVYIGGRVDGLCYDYTGLLYKIVEVKNRIYKLFYKLRDYEKIQCHIYMKLLDLNDTDLVECFKDDDVKINVIEVKFDNLFYENEIEARLFNFINYLIDIIDDSKINYETTIYETFNNKV
tara:strand:- start:1274 stop:2134 length:861 start_codon:yes stop_codon:yes gene_type:complete